MSNTNDKKQISGDKKAAHKRGGLHGAVRILLLAIAATVIGLNVYMLNATRLGGDPVPMPFGVGAAVVLSGSMEPELSVGDLILVTAQPDYAVGDVVVYLDGRTAVVHRIIQMDGDTVITQGDANNVPDGEITREQIKGKMAMRLPLIGHAVNVIKTPIGTLVILALAIYLLERSFHQKKQSDQQKLDEIRAEIERLKQESEQ
jgi:signal peptidase